MRRATRHVIQEWQERKCQPRTAAMTLALSRIEKVYVERGIFP
jgi:glutamate dehydrogenase/leucine dehydrogenase